MIDDRVQRGKSRRMPPVTQVAMRRAYRQPRHHHAQQPGSYADGDFDGRLHSRIISPGSGSNTNGGATEFGSFSPRIVATDFDSPSSPPSIIVLFSAVMLMSAIAAAASINSGVIFPGSTAPATAAAGRTLCLCCQCVNKAPGNNSLSQPHDGAHTKKPPPFQPKKKPVRSFPHWCIPLRPGNNSSEEQRSF